MTKKDQKSLRQLLQANVPPKPEAQKRRLFIAQLVADAADMDYLGQETFLKKLLTIGSCFSVWTWIVDFALLAFFICFTFFQEGTVTLVLLLLLAPGLVLILLHELSRIFSNGMWELEAACRYNLPQLFFLRLTLLSGMDLFLLALCLAVFQMTGGLLWQFAVYTLLPFFLLSSLCLLLLRRLGSRGQPGVIGAAILLVDALWAPFTELFRRIQVDFGDIVLERVVLAVTLAAAALYLGSAAALCLKKYHEHTRKEYFTWSFE